MVINSKKIFGWLVLAIGLAIIFWAIISSYNYFQGNESFPEIFKISENEISTQETSSKNLQIPAQTSQEELQALLQEQAQEQIQQSISQLIPKSTISQLLNLICWVIFAFFLISAGAHIADLGIKLLKQ